MPGDKARPPAAAPRVAGSGTAKSQIAGSIIARREAAVARLAAQDRRLRWARLAHKAMPLTVYYRGGLLEVPLGQLDARGRWAA